MKFHLIWAQDENGAIGKNNDLPWHIPEDLINFKKITLNHTIVMGRKTWDSLPKKPLPNRRNIVLSSKKIDDVECYPSINSCIESLRKDNVSDLFVIGGEMIYSSFLNYANTLHITFINKSVEGIDTYFPFDMNKIKNDYQITEESMLVKDCIYTKWIRK